MLLQQWHPAAGGGGVPARHVMEDRVTTSDHGHLYRGFGHSFRDWFLKVAIQTQEPIQPLPFKVTHERDGRQKKTWHQYLKLLEAEILLH